MSSDVVVGCAVGIPVGVVAIGFGLVAMRVRHNRKAEAAKDQESTAAFEALLFDAQAVPSVHSEPLAQDPDESHEMVSPQRPVVQSRMSQAPSFYDLVVPVIAGTADLDLASLARRLGLTPQVNGYHATVSPSAPGLRAVLVLSGTRNSSHLSMNEIIKAANRDGHGGVEGLVHTKTLSDPFTVRSPPPPPVADETDSVEGLQIVAPDPHPYQLLA